MIKKSNSFLLVTMLAFSFIGCGSNASQTDTKTMVKIENNIEETKEPEKVEMKYYEEDNAIPTPDTFLGGEAEIVLVSKEKDGYRYSLGSDKEEAENIYKLYLAMLTSLDGVEIEQVEASIFNVKKDSKELLILAAAPDKNGEYIMIVQFYAK